MYGSAAVAPSQQYKDKTVLSHYTCCQKASSLAGDCYQPQLREKMAFLICVLLFFFLRLCLAQLPEPFANFTIVQSQVNPAVKLSYKQVSTTIGNVEPC